MGRLTHNLPSLFLGLLVAPLGTPPQAYADGPKVIGFWADGAGGTTNALFPGEQQSPVTADNAYTASDGDAVVECFLSRGSSGNKTVQVGIFEFDAGANRPTGPALFETTIATTASGVWSTGPIDWPLTDGLDYVVAVGGLLETSFNMTGAVPTQGTSSSSSGVGSLNSWTHEGYSNVQIELACDVLNTAPASSAVAKIYLQH